MILLWFIYVFIGLGVFASTRGFWRGLLLALFWPVVALYGIGRSLGR